MPIDALDLLRQYRQAELDFAAASAETAPAPQRLGHAAYRLHFVRQQVDAAIAPAEPQPSTTPAGIETVIADACDYADHVRITYRDAHGDYSHRLIAPSEIRQAAARRTKIVAAYDVDKQEPRHFRLDRISAAAAVLA